MPLCAASTSLGDGMRQPPDCRVLDRARRGDHAHRWGLWHRAGGPDDDWFDRHLTVDTKLFVDPFLLLVEGGRWAAAHDELIEHFVECYRLVGRATSPTSVSGLAARRLLTFPEPAEFGLATRRQVRPALAPGPATPARSQMVLPWPSPAA